MRAAWHPRSLRTHITPLAHTARERSGRVSDAPLWCIEFTMWHSDIGTVVEADIGKEHWAAFRAESARGLGLAIEV